MASVNFKDTPQMWHVEQCLKSWNVTTYDIGIFYAVQTEMMFAGLELRDLDNDPQKRDIYKRIENLVRNHICQANSEYGEWITECRTFHENTIKQGKLDPSPYDINNFIMDLSEISNAQPIPALFTLKDHKGKEQLFIPRGKVCVLASEGGLGKSLLALHLGMQLALNQDTNLRSWCGDPLKPVPRSGKVVLLYAEEDKQSCLFRMRQMLSNENGIVNADLINRLSGRLIPAPLCISDKNADSSLGLSDSIRSGDTGAEQRRNRLFQSLETIGGDEGLDLIVVDPLAQFGGSDFETDNGEASRLMRHIQQLTGLKGNPTVLIVHHSAKAAKKNKLAHGIRGSSAIKDNARQACILRRVDESDTGEDYLKDDLKRGVLELVIAKSNYGPNFLSVRCICHDSKIIDIPAGSNLLHTKTKLKTAKQSQDEYEEKVLETPSKYDLNKEFM